MYKQKTNQTKQETPQNNKCPQKQNQKIQLTEKSPYGFLFLFLLTNY